MCTAITGQKGGSLFGRTFDLELSYGEELIITPREYTFDFEKGKHETRFALIGIGCVKKGVPLYYDAMNECGLFAAALNFPKSCAYHGEIAGKVNVPSYELISRILRECDSLESARTLLENVNVTRYGFDVTLPPSPLHFIIADRHGAVCAESVREGLRIYDDPFGVMTNEPPFPYHMTNLTNYQSLRASVPENTLCPDVKLDAYSRGMGAFGLPGDFSSVSRFVRAVFLKNHTEKYGTDCAAEISRFFHIADSVAVPYGSVRTKENACVATLYTSCACADTLSYYFTTYACRRIKCVRLRDFPTDSTALIRFPLGEKEDVELLS